MQNEDVKVMPLSKEQVAELLLWPLWRCLSEEYKSRYKKEIWEHFENAVRSAAYTGQLTTYLTNFQKKIPVDLQQQFMKDILKVVNSLQDEEILNWLRGETTYMVMLVRVKNQTRNEEYKQRIEAEQIEECDFDDINK